MPPNGLLHTAEEAIELHQNLQIDILAFRRLAMAATHMVAIQVDTCAQMLALNIVN